MSGSMEVASEQSYNFIINAFVYSDPANARFFIDGEKRIRFAQTQEEWRAAMQYLYTFYTDGLLSPFQFTGSHATLAEMANNPSRLVGCFTSESITDVIYESNPEILSEYIHITPLTTAGGAARATRLAPMPSPAGVISAASKHTDAVFALFDLMLSEEAFLIGRYGECGVDWRPASVTDIDLYGKPATVNVLNQLGGRVQNKHLNEIGPFYAYLQYADGVTWSGFEADRQYLNARAHQAYSAYLPKDAPPPLAPLGAFSTIRKQIAANSLLPSRRASAEVLNRQRF